MHVLLQLHGTSHKYKKLTVWFVFLSKVGVDYVSAQFVAIWNLVIDSILNWNSNNINSERTKFSKSYSFELCPFALFFLLNASLNRPVSLRAETADMPATSVALYCCHLLLCPPVSNTRLLWLQKASCCYFNVMSPLLSHAVSPFLSSFAPCCLNSVCCVHEIL